MDKNSMFIDLLCHVKKASRKSEILVCFKRQKNRKLRLSPVNTSFSDELFY